MNHMQNLTAEQHAQIVTDINIRKMEQERFHKENIDKVWVYKECSCGKLVTNHNCKLIGRNRIGLWFNCLCGSTLVQRSI